MQVGPSLARSNGSRLNAFTLVELLVVIGIIAVLISVLLPALNKARDSAYRVRCMSNQRQILLAAQLYVNEYRMYPPVDGSWLDRVKKGANNPLGMGKLLAGNYLQASGERTIAGIMFCPSSKPALEGLSTGLNTRSPNSVYVQIKTTPTSTNDAYSTYVGKFCTFNAFNDPILGPTRANLYPSGKQSAKKISPILTVDYWFGSTGTSANDLVHGEQGHRGLGVVAGFHDGSVRWIPVSEVQLVVGGTSKMANRAPSNPFWRFARVAYGDGKNSATP